ncbi:ParM/StbA family protein [Clostridium sp. LQ25]|uniref:ParM/StbA family protein n=1 Tax=Clostridium sp. LQ25 TaxID=2992805 RepID=UPI0022535287|nr:ParM/StbA family protein [Clostridium sp. LQ25]UZT06177.1 ParM/StbA family protein [Clostridium sp. LQ25]
MINTSLLIAVDAGKDTTKYVYKNELGILQKGSFRTKVKVTDNFGADIEGKTFKIEFEGKSYLVGDMVSENKLNYDLSKTSIEHKLCVYVAITNIIKKTGINNISVAIGAPLNVYKNSILKEEYSKYIKGTGQVNIKINGEEIKFYINDVLVLPESIGPIYQDLNEYRNSRAVIIDIGGLNTNICRFNNLVPDVSKMIVANKGGNILKSKIADALSEKYGIIIYKEDIDSILKDKVLYIQGKQQEDSKNTIKKLMIEHLEDIINFCKQNELDILNVNGKIVFSGGGSLLLKEIIQEKYSYAKIATDAQFSNVQAFYKVLSIKNEG